MSDFIATILSMSIGGSILIALVLLMEKVAGKATGRQWQYYIWLIVVARLLIPFGPSLQIGLPEDIDERTVASAGAAALQTQGSLPALEDITPGAGESADGTSSAAAGSEEAEANPEEAKSSAAMSSPWTNAGNIAFIVWVCGFLALLTRRVTAYQSFQKYVRAGMVPCDDPAKLDALADAAAQCGIRRPVEAAANPLISSPMLIGLVHPCIVLPNEKISNAEFRYAALHELTHLRRLDLVYKWLVQLAVCVHWFNPLVHIMEKRVRKACEFSCDEAVVRRDGPDSAVPYGMTLLNAMACAGTYSEPAASVNLSENKRLLKERLEELKTYEQRRKASAVVLSIFIAACLVGTTACTGVYRRGVRDGWYVPASGRTFSDRKLESLGAMPQDGHIRLDIKECSVRILDTADLETAEGGPLIAASYDPSLFSADLSGNIIRCRPKGRANRSHMSAQYLELFVPVDALQSAEIDADNSFVSFDSVPYDTEISGIAADGMTVAWFPEEYNGTFTLNSPNSYTVLQSADDFAGTTVSITAEYIATPPGVEPTTFGDVVTLNNGGDGCITVDADNGMVSVGNIGFTPETLDKLEFLDSLSAAEKSQLVDAFANEIADRAEAFAERIEEGAFGFADRIAAGADAWADAFEEAFEKRTAPPAPSAPSAPSAPRPDAAKQAGSTDAPDESASPSPAPTEQSLVGGIVRDAVRGALSAVGEVFVSTAAETGSAQS